MTKDIAPIYETLKREIVTIQLKPGTRIREESVSERFGVSRTPVRDVLKKLEEDKLSRSSRNPVPSSRNSTSTA